MSQGKYFEDDPTFQRQRRLLLVISLVLVFYVITGVEITEISIFGNTADLQSQRGVGVFLWILWVYWFVRFWQSFLEQDLSGLSQAYERNTESPLRLFALRMARRDEELAESICEDHDKITTPRFDLYRGGVFSANRDRPGMVRVETGMIVVNKKNKHGPAAEITAGPYDCAGPWLWFVRGYAVGQTARNTRFVTEFYLPFIVGFLPVFAVALKKWTNLI